MRKINNIFTSILIDELINHNKIKERFFMRKLYTVLTALIWLFSLVQINAQMPGNYINPDFNFQSALTDTNSPGYGGQGATWQECIYTGLGNYDFFASYLSENGNETWKFFGFSWNGTGYDVTWTYTQTGMSGSNEANERMMVVGDWNGDGKEELIIGIDPEQTDSVNLLVFEPDVSGNLPSTPTARLLTPKAPRWFNTTPPVTEMRFSWSSPPSYIRDIDNNGVPDFVGFSYEGVITGWYTGDWSDPNASDNVVWTYVDSMLCNAATLADLDGDGMVELVNASARGFGPVGENDLPGTFKRRDYFAISTPNGDGTFTTTRMASPLDSLRMANGYKALPYLFGGGGWHADKSFDIDGDGRDEVFVADWNAVGVPDKGCRFWMIDIGNKDVVDIDSSDFYLLADFRSLFSTEPDPLYPSSLQEVDVNGNGRPEFYTGLGPWGGAQAVARVEYTGGDPKLAASWEAQLVYQDTTNHMFPRQVLTANDITGNSKQEIVIINGNFGNPGAGGRIITLESKTVTDVKEENGILPDKYALLQNYPNPFNPSTIIEYNIPKESHVKLDVYNILGQKVAQLVNEVKIAGKYKVTFNAGNFANGVYFYKIEAGQFVQAKKMILLK
jgi:hypothetical protein